MRTTFFKNPAWSKLGGIVRGITVGLSCAVIAGCSEKTPAPGNESAVERVVIKGSNTVGEELAPRLIAEYKKDHPAAVIDLETKGSASGFWGLIGGVCDVAAASRTPIADEERQALAHSIEFTDHVIGSYSVAVIVNAENPINNLTGDQIRDLYTGAVQNWKDVGGQDAPVHLFIRNPISGTYLGFRELALQDRPYSTNNVTASMTYTGIMKAVAHDPYALGYSSLQLATKPGVKAVSVNGVPVDVASVQQGKYPFTRVLHLYTTKSREAPLAHDFIQFAQSSRGQAIVSEMGFVPHP
jgi:phosphate transport system substrate-binding protein